MGDHERAAEAEATLAEVHMLRGDTNRSTQCLARARELMDGREPSRAKASVIVSVSRRLMMSGDSREALRLGREALAMAEQLGLDDIRALALMTIGNAKDNIGDMSCFEDYQHGLAVATQANAPVAICQLQMNLGAALHSHGQLERSAASLHAAGETASRFGVIQEQPWIRSHNAMSGLARGQWEEALVLADALLEDVKNGSPHYVAYMVLGIRSLIRLGRDDVTGALADIGQALQFARLIRLRRLSSPRP